MTGQTTNPDFIYVGAPRAGSTWLFTILAVHPHVFVPRIKAIEYFSHYYGKGWGWYERFFAPALSDQVTGELSTGYLSHPEALSRIATDLPRVKILVTVRNPIERDYSAYIYGKKVGHLKTSLQQALVSRDGPSWVTGAGLYANLLSPLYTLFPAESIHLSLFDTLRAQPEVFAKELFTFLGIETGHAQIDSDKVNAVSFPRGPMTSLLIRMGRLVFKPLGRTSLYPRMRDSRLVQRALFSNKRRAPRERISREDYRFLRDYYEPHIEEVERRLGVSLDSWRKRPDFIE